jgi:outer membrane protein assembly factor BamA
LTFGFGYGSEEHARVRVRWDHVNFFGGARHAGFEARWSSLNRGVRADLREPYVLHKNLSLNFEGQAWQATEPVYSQNTLGGRVALRYQATERQFMSVSLINEYQKSSVVPEALTDFTIRDDLIALGLDPRTGETRGTLSAISIDAGRNTTGSLLDARRGYMLSARIEQAGRWMWGSYNYWSAAAEARHYQSLGGRFVVANRLNVGSIDPAGEVDANVPFHKRYFLGGASSNRGWGRFELSPLSGFGFPIGGLSMLDGSAEVRFPVMGKLGGVLFLDYGNVWFDPWTFDVRDLRYAVGPGLRYQTPVGPARIDLGYQLNPIDNLLVEGEPQKRQWRVHFSIGQAF